MSAREWLDGPTEVVTYVEAPRGCWLVRYADWSGVAIFGDEVSALRYAVEKQMQVCEFVPWGEVR